MLDVTPTGWAATLAVIAGLLALDWYVLGRRPHAIDLGEAARWSMLYIAIAVSFGVAFGLLNGGISAGSTSPATSSRRVFPSTTCSCSF
jgi:tellurite resistance protein TerC